MDQRSRNVVMGLGSLSDILIVFGVGVLFFPMFVKLFAYGWPNADYDHGMFIAPIALWIIWTRRAELVARPVWHPLAALLFGCSILLYVFSSRNEFVFLQAFSFAAVVTSIFLSRFTFNSVKSLAFPLSYMMFMIPPPSLLIDTLTFPLKTISIQGSYFLLRSFDVPVKIQGAILNVDGSNLFVTDACSGFRSIATLLALGALYAYYQKTTNLKKWILWLAVIPLGIIGNILRITLTGWITLNFGLEFAERFFHEFSGIIVFLFVIVGLMMLAGVLCTEREIYETY